MDKETQIIHDLHMESFLAAVTLAEEQIDPSHENFNQELYDLFDRTPAELIRVDTSFNFWCEDS